MVEQPHFGRTAPARAFVDLGQPGIDPGGIGDKGGLGLGVLTGKRPACQIVKVQTAQQDIDR